MDNVLMVLIIALFAFFLMCLDNRYSQKRLEHNLKEPEGVSGFRRAIIALVLILVLAALLFKLPNLQEHCEKVRPIYEHTIGILEGIIGTVAGFYFGRATAKPPQSSEHNKKEVSSVTHRTS